MKRALLVALAVWLALADWEAKAQRPARMDETGWVAMGAPAGATLGCIGVFLGSLTCVPGLTYAGGVLSVPGAVSARQTADSATLGAELALNAGFAADLTGWSGANWAWEAGTDGQARHTAGSTAALTQNVTVVNGATYQISFGITGRTAGTWSPARCRGGWGRGRSGWSPGTAFGDQLPVFGSGRAVSRPGGPDGRDRSRGERGPDR